MKIGAKQYAQALYESLSEVRDSDADKVLDNFTALLAANSHLSWFEEIAVEFHRIELGKKGVKMVQLVSAHPLSKQSEAQIIEELNKLVKSKIELKKKIDENLVGGVVIRVEDKLIDLSAKNQLEQLKSELSS